jgi:hypothetical protein
MPDSTCPCCHQKVIHTDHYRKGKPNRDYRPPCDTCKHQDIHMTDYPCASCTRLPEPHKP